MENVCLAPQIAITVLPIVSVQSVALIIIFTNKLVPINALILLLHSQIHNLAKIVLLDVQLARMERIA